ncbi:MAG: CRISPR-associated endonuclease Cas3'', partial [Oscillospiraceae bacterium]|nr:CRISPR-associated endonuclease Cas3'' [Oscillospiraceae bacterium]
MKTLKARPQQLLVDHSLQVAELAARFGVKADVAETARCAGLLHDCGKALQSFQDYVEDLEAGKPVRRGDAPHSPASARRVYGLMAGSRSISEILANVIYAHHGSLYDFVTPNGEADLTDRTLQVVSECVDDIPASAPDAQALAGEFMSSVMRLHTEDQAFGSSMLIKFIYSCLVDADRLDAYLFETGKSYSNERMNWEPLCEKLETHLSMLSKEGDIAAVRHKVSGQCFKAAARRRGIYRLSVPTGGGKTLSSLRFAMNHAKIHNMDRIIYVIPYLSITEQVVLEIRKALGDFDDCVLEHHSDFLPDDRAYYKVRPYVLITSACGLLEFCLKRAVGII